MVAVVVVVVMVAENETARVYPVLTSRNNYLILRRSNTEP